MEAGIVLLEDGAIVEEWSTLVNPEVRIPYAIQQFTGITEAMVADAPPFARVADEIASRIEGRLFVAHNARFDYGFLRGEFRRLGRRFRAPVLCTVRLSRALTPDERGHNLDAVMTRHGISCEARHRALGDARVLAEFLGIARARWPAGDARPGGRAADLRPAAAAAARPRARGRAAGRAGRLPLPRRGRRAALRRQGEEPRDPRARAFRRTALEARRRDRAARPAHRVDRDGRRVRRAPDRGAAHQGREGPLFNRRPRGSDALWGIHLREDGAMPLAGDPRAGRARRSRRQLRDLPARRGRRARTRRARRAPTSCARNGWDSSPGRAPASASSSGAAAASASARSRPRSTPCA